MDKFGFKILMFIIAGIEILISSAFSFSATIAHLYIFSVLLISSYIGGNFAIL